MKSGSLVSIIIPYFNSHAYFKDLLISIDNQTIKNIEIIVIDDKSELDSQKKLTEIVQLFPHLPITVDMNQSHFGAGESRNRGFAMAKGEYIMFIDADDLVCGRYSLEYRVHFLKENSRFSGIGGYPLKIDEDNRLLLNIADKTIDYFREGVMSLENLRTLYALNILNSSVKSASALFFAAGSCLFRYVDLVDFPFDANYEHEEDMEWLLRLMAEKRIKLEMIPFHGRRLHEAQYSRNTPLQITEKVKEICRKIVDAK